MALSCFNVDTAALEPEIHAVDMALQSHAWRACARAWKALVSKDNAAHDVGIARHEPYSKIE